MPRYSAIAALVAVVLLYQHMAVLADADVATFTVGKTGSDTKSVSLGNYRCKLAYSTGASLAPVVLEEKPVVQSVEQVLAQLQGSCVKKLEDYWAYTLCFGGDAKQVHDNEAFNLGHYSTSRGAMQLYTGGTACGNSKGTPRSTEVQIACGKRLELVAVKETSTCKYLMQTTAPQACGVDGFAQAVDHSKLSSGGGGASPDDPEPWVLEMMETLNGDVICRAFSVIDIKQGGAVGDVPTISFKNWALSMWESGSTSPMSFVTAEARKASRAHIAELTVDESAEPSSKLTVKGSSGTALGFVSLQGKPKPHM